MIAMHAMSTNKPPAINGRHHVNRVDDFTETTVDCVLLPTTGRGWMTAAATVALAAW